MVTTSPDRVGFHLMDETPPGPAGPKFVPIDDYELCPPGARHQQEAFPP